MKKLLYLLVLVPFPLLADARLASVSDRGLNVSCTGIASEAAAVQCAVSEDNLALIDVFQMTNPARVVMDLEERPRGKSFKKKATVHETLAGIRTGWHPEKYRIVFDLRSDEAVTFSWRQEKNTVHLLINSAGEAASTLSAPEVHAAQRIFSETRTGEPGTRTVSEPTDQKSKYPQILPVVARSSVLPADHVKTSTCDPVSDGTCQDTSISEEAAEPLKEALGNIAQRGEADRAGDIAQAKPAARSLTVNEPVTAQHITVWKPTALSRVAVISPPLPTMRSIAPELSGRQDMQAEVIAESHSNPVVEEQSGLDERDAVARARMKPEFLNEADRASQRQMLHGISFSVSSDGQDSVVHLKLNQKPHFNLSKLGPRTYRLRILDCSVKDDSLTLPFFPPHTFPRVSFLQAEPNSRRTEITIGVERGTRLMAVSSDHGIDIKVIG